MARRILSLLLCILILFSFSACGQDHSTKKILDYGIDGFDKGKIEEDYSIKGSGVTLDELIDKFSGSYYFPTVNPADDDDKSGNGGSGYPSGDSDPSGGSGFSKDDVPTVSSFTDLLRVFHNAYDETSEDVCFTLSGGYQFNPLADLQAVYTKLQRDDPIDVSGVASWSWWDSNGSNDVIYNVKINYFFEVEELKRIKVETVKLVKDAVEKIGAKGLSDYEIIKAVNEYLCDTVYYPPNEPYEPITHTAYGALKNGCAVCEGYACAAKLLFSSYGIESDIEVGVCMNGSGHAWNLVKLNGQWYQLDITWNDQTKSRKDYFLVTDDFMKQSRTWDEGEYPVSAKFPYVA